MERNMIRLLVLRRSAAICFLVAACLISDLQAQADIIAEYDPHTLPNFLLATVNRRVA
jgi:hypothetical protein